MFMFLLAPFILQNLKKTFRADQSYEDVSFSSPKWPIYPEQNFFGTNHYYYFHLPIGPLHCATFKKIFTADLQLRGCAIFGAKMVHLPQFFFGKKINIIFIYLLAPFIVQNFKNFLHRIQSYEDVPFWDPKWSTCPNENFFRKPVNRPCSFHSCVSECKKSKSDINLLMKY